ncbi:lipoprotein [Streptomonospora halophila]|uniref:Lipoprotein n=2 Tax=Streptomonospora halophila TaxID=427369 RepID=A0ABP9G6Y5_9ACTN
MHTMMGSRAGAALALAAGGLMAAGCGAGAAEPSGGEESAPHGHVEGAREAAEPQWRLVLADTAAGSLHTLDPATKKAARVGEAAGAEEAATDGRFAYFSSGGSTTVLDSGAWTVDHGDHVHYYTAEPAVLGEVATGGGLRAAADKAVSALVSGAGIRFLDRAALADGEIVRTAADLGGAAALPYGERLVVAGRDGSVRVFDRSGASAAAAIAEDCPDPRGQAVTRRGAVIGCSDGALVVTGEGGSLKAEKIAYPDEGADPVRSFHHRPGAPVLAGAAGDDGVWVLDVAAGEWTLLDTGPAAAVSAAGEQMPLLVLGEDGRLSAYDPATGERTAQNRLMDAETAGASPAPSLTVDTARAYVNDPAADAVYEVDYNDDLRLARTFDLAFSPDLMVETGW